MATLAELMQLSALQSPGSPSIWDDFRRDWGNALTELEARERDIRPAQGETISNLRDEILAPIEGKWSSIMGLPSSRREAAEPRDRMQAITRPDGSVILANLDQGTAAPFNAAPAAQAGAPGRSGFFYAGSEAGLPIAEQRFDLGLPSMAGSPMQAGPRQEATSVLQGASPSEAIGAGVQWLQNTFGLPAASPAAQPAPADNLTGPMSRPGTGFPSTPPEIMMLPTEGTNTVPVLTYGNRSGTHATPIRTPQLYDSSRLVIQSALKRRDDAMQRLSVFGKNPTLKAALQKQIDDANEELAQLGVPIGGGSKTNAVKRLRWTPQGLVPIQ